MEAYMICLLIALAACVIGIFLSYRERRKAKEEYAMRESVRTGRSSPHSIRN